MNIALLSPNKNKYSETFIQNHKKNIFGNVIFYFGGFIPENCEKEGSLKMSLSNKVLYKLSQKINNNILSEREISLAKSFKRNKISVVVAEFGPTGAGVVEVCKELKLPLITIFHGYDICVKQIVKQNLNAYNNLFNNSYKIIAVSTTLKEKLENINCPKNKIIVSPCGPDNSFYEHDPVLQSSQFLACGRFVDKKAPYYTILAFNKVLKKNPDATLVMVGDGELFNMSENLIKYLKIEKNVKLIGEITPNELKEIMINSIGFVQHSIEAKSGDMEGTPVAILEASLLGLPIISTKHSGIIDVVKHNGTGYLVEEHDVDQMAFYMSEILSNKELAKKLGKEGKKYIFNNFSQDHHINTLNGVIKSSLE